MANTSSARERVRSSQRKHERNRRVRSAARTAVGRARRALAGSDSTLVEPLVRVASSVLDKAAEHGVLHRRNVSRRKSRLMRLAARVTAEEASAIAEQASRKRAGTARGTKAKVTSTAKRAAAKAKPQTKTERTAARARRSAGSQAPDQAD